MPNNLIYLIDDDNGFRESAKWMLEGHGYEIKSYADTELAISSLVDQSRTQRVVILLDIRMPQMSGLELHNALNDRGIRFPIIYMTGHGDIAVAVEAMSKGAVTFLEKPLDEFALITALDTAFVQPLETNVAKITGKSRVSFLDYVKTLSKRESEVMHSVADGKSSLVVAANLGISVKTVDMHRSRVLKKLHVHNAQQLTKMVMLCL